MHEGSARLVGGKVRSHMAPSHLRLLDLT